MTDVSIINDQLHILNGQIADFVILLQKQNKQLDRIAKTLERMEARQS